MEMAVRNLIEMGWDESQAWTEIDRQIEAGEFIPATSEWINSGDGWRLSL